MARIALTKSILLAKRYQYLASIVLRGLTLFSKLLLVFLLARFLEPRDLGIYGLPTATVGYGIYLVGFEFYTYSSRELISAATEQRMNILKNQVVLYLIIYGISIIILFALMVANVFPEKYFYWVVALLVLEHFAQELNRTLVALSQQLYASLILFVRMGSWGLLVIAFQWALPEARTIEFVLSAWLAGVFLACTLGIILVNKLVPSWEGGKSILFG